MFKKFCSSFFEVPWNCEENKKKILENEEQIWILSRETMVDMCFIEFLDIINEILRNHTRNFKKSLT